MLTKINYKFLISNFLIAIFLIGCTPEAVVNRLLEEEETDIALYKTPSAKAYVTYISQNAVTLNGFIDLDNIAFIDGPDNYEVGFIFRKGNETDSSNDQEIIVKNDVPYFSGTYNFDYEIKDLEPNTTYYYAATTKNGNDAIENWESFTTSETPCSYERDNYYSISGTWKEAYVEITDPSCCDKGSVGFRFGTWPNTFQINFNEQEGGFPKTGQYFGVNQNGFDLTHNNSELVKSTNQVFLEYDSTTETQLFVENDGERVTIIFCNMLLMNGDIINGKVSIKIP
ncbi:fibronectin type III domain-containing protein [uncultured Maribacter sp.]|uniref:fibronectin type III domain-containing protein n=1 Tax=uncultured Maribacter sp. TaxID=431308 RepID=UPI0026191F91|nr:fibronectin type III domain-containing protein [uncultured Maribacter sp.]